MGNFEYEILAAVRRLGSTAYGAAVWEDLEERGGRRVAAGALYTVLGRLERKGYLSSRVGEPTPERGGRAKRYYRVEAPGVTAMREHEARLSVSLPGLVPEGT